MFMAGKRNALIMDDLGHSPLYYIRRETGVDFCEVDKGTLWSRIALIILHDSAEEEEEEEEEEEKEKEEEEEDEDEEDGEEEDEDEEDEEEEDEEEERTTILRNVWKYSYKDTAAYHRRFEFSAIPLSEPQISQ